MESIDLAPVQASPSKLASPVKCCIYRSGFTLVEVVSVLVIFAILALVALPRFFDRQVFDARIFHGQVQSMLRHAQKIAIAQNRNVHVRLNGTSLAFCFAAFPVAGTCDNTDQVPAPGGENSGSADTLARCSNRRTWFCEAVPLGMSYVVAPVGGDPAIQSFYFNALGKPFALNDTAPVSHFTRLDLTLSGDGSTRHVFVEAETGYVHP
jgi:MSHA pilin protein MshC